MRVESEKMRRAPEKGMALIYFRRGIYYGEYWMEQGELCLKEDKQFEQDQLLELHLFDESVEYRRVWSDEAQGYLETLVTDGQQEYDEKMQECCFTEKHGNERLCVVHYFIYDEDDRLVLVNYRLSEWKGGNQGE